jgi:hypothetical protein
VSWSLRNLEVGGITAGFSLDTPIAGIGASVGSYPTTCDLMSGKSRIRDSTPIRSAGRVARTA